MRSLGGIGRAYLRHRRARSVLTGLGVLLGVGLIFGVLVANSSIGQGFDALRRETTGAADVVVHPIGVAGSLLPPDVLGQLRELPDVEDVTASLDVAAAAEDGSTALLLGVDERHATITGYEPIEGRLPEPGADEVVLTSGHGPGVGSVLVLATPTGQQRLTVVGLLEDDGFGEIQDGQIKLTSLRTAQRLAGEPTGVSGARAVLGDVDEVQWLDEHELAIRGTRLQDAQQGLNASVWTTSLTSFAAIALFISAFLIYLTLSAAIIERTAVYGTLRALGATRRQVRRVVLREAVWLGAAATAAGLVLGLAIGAVLTRLFVALEDLPTSSLTIRPSALLTAVALGLGVTSLSAWLPARRAGRLSPVVAMRGDVPGRVGLGRSWIAGALLAAVSMLARLSAPPFPLSMIVMLTFLAGVVLLMPLILGPIARLSGWVLRRVSGGLTHVTVMHLIKERSRSAYTMGLILVVLAFGLTMGAVRESLLKLAEDSTAAAAEITVLGPNLLTPQTKELVATTDGVAQVSELRFGSTAVLDDDQEFFAGLSIIEPETYFLVQDSLWVEGDGATAAKALAGGDNIVLTEPMMKALDLEVGDEVTLRTATGTAPFRVAAVTAGMGGWQVTTGTPVGKRHFGGGAPHSLIASVDDGADAESVRASLREKLHAGDDWSWRDDSFNVAGPETLTRAIRSELNSILNILLGVVAVALLAGILGLANTLVMSVLQRVREIGLLRSLGASQRAIRRMVVTEAALLVTFAYVLAIPVAFVVYSGMSSSAEGLGFTPRAGGPGPLGVILAVVMVVVAFVAGWFPARRASRVVITDALRVE